MRLSKPGLIVLRTHRRALLSSIVIAGVVMGTVLGLWALVNMLVEHSSLDSSSMVGGLSNLLLAVLFAAQDSYSKRFVARFLARNLSGGKPGSSIARTGASISQLALLRLSVRATIVASQLALLGIVLVASVGAAAGISLLASFSLVVFVIGLKHFRIAKTLFTPLNPKTRKSLQKRTKREHSGLEFNGEDIHAVTRVFAASETYVQSRSLSFDEFLVVTFAAAIPFLSLILTSSTHTGATLVLVILVFQRNHSLVMVGGLLSRKILSQGRLADEGEPE